eukprot:3122547-Prymnesium_polylepis.1
MVARTRRDKCPVSRSSRPPAPRRRASRHRHTHSPDPPTHACPHVRRGGGATRLTGEVYNLAALC